MPVESLQEQLGPDFEIIVVDNADDLDTFKQLEIVKRGATRPVIMLSEPRLGNHYAPYGRSRFEYRSTDLC